VSRRAPVGIAPVVAPRVPAIAFIFTEGGVADGIGGPTGTGRIARWAEDRRVAAAGLGEADHPPPDEVLAAQSGGLVTLATGRGLVARRQAGGHRALARVGEARREALLVAEIAARAARRLRRNHGTGIRSLRRRRSGALGARGNARRAQEQQPDDDQ